VKSQELLDENLREWLKIELNEKPTEREKKKAVIAS
jgi:hypothetical protein